MMEIPITLRLNELRAQDKLSTRDGDYIYNNVRNHHVVEYFKVKAPHATELQIAGGVFDEELIGSWHDAAHMEWVAYDTAKHDAENMGDNGLDENGYDIEDDEEDEFEDEDDEDDDDDDDDDLDDDEDEDEELDEEDEV